MNQVKLMESVDCMKEEHLLTKADCEELGIELSKRMMQKSDYSVLGDPRIKDYYKRARIEEKDDAERLRNYSYVVSTLVCQAKLRIPSDEQLMEMLEISGYSGKEMEDYVINSPLELKAYVKSRSHVQTTFLIARLLYEALSDPKAWEKNRRGETQSMQKLKELLQYMEQEELLVISNECNQYYEDYILNRAKRNSIAIAFYEEYKEAFWLYVNSYVEKEAPVMAEQFKRETETKVEAMNDKLRASDEEWKKMGNFEKISEGAFREILDGDDVYQLKIARVIIDQFIYGCGFLSGLFSATSPEYRNGWVCVEENMSDECYEQVIGETDTIEYTMNEGQIIPIQLSAIISGCAGKNFDGSLRIRKDLVKRLQQSGCTEGQARDCAIIEALLEKLERSEQDKFDMAFEYPSETSEAGAKRKEEKLKAQETERQLAESVKKCEELERKIRELKAEGKKDRHTIMTLSRENERLKKERKSGNKQTGEEKENRKKNEPKGSENERKSLFPYYTDLKVVVYGGREDAQKRLQEEYYPNVRILRCGPHVDVTPACNADVVFFCPDQIGHSQSGTVSAACRRNNVEHCTLNGGGAETWAWEMLTKIKELEQDGTACA